MSPPWITSRLLARLLPETERDAIIGDLEEGFRHRMNRDGAVAARRWYRREALAAVRMTFSPTAGHELPPARLFAMGDLIHEFRFALRQLRRRPLYAGIVIATLAVGIGATSAVLSVANPVLFRPLPYPDPDRLVRLGAQEPSGSFSDRIGYLTIADVRRNVRGLERVAAISEWHPVLMTPTESERLIGQSVTADFFKVLGVEPLLGRDFTPAEDAYGQNRVVILSHRLWRSRFNADPAAVGQSVQLGAYRFTVAGVLPESFESLLNPAAQIWRPLGYNDTLPSACRTCQHLGVVARLRSTSTLEAVQAELATESARLLQDHPTEYAMRGLRAEPMHAHLVSDVKPALLMMLGAGIFVLAIACANVGNLILARTTEREAELALRTSLGAGPLRLMSQLMTETIVLCLAGAVAGLALAKVGVAAVLSLAPADMPRLEAVSLDWRVTLMTLGASLGVALLTGVVPGLVSLRRAVSAAASRSVTSGRKQKQVTAALVIAEVSLAFMLLSGAGLLTRSLERVLSVDPGFDPSNLLTMSVLASGPRYQTDSAVWQTQDELMRVLSQMPQLEAVGFSHQIPLGGNFDRFGVALEDQPLANPEEAPSADRYTVSPGYVSTMRIPVKRGRDLTEQDRGGAVPVALINETFARMFWSGSDPIGKRIRMGGNETPWRTIVGVVGDVKHVGLDATQFPQFYVPATQWLWSENGFVVVLRTRGEPSAVAAEARRVIRSVDPALAIQEIATAGNLITNTTSARRLIVRLFEAFAGVALLLAAAGIYGLLSRRVAERHRELGIRSALGATRGGILELVLRDGGRLAVIGIGLGLVGALALARLLEGLLFNIAARDPVTLGLSGLTLGGVALIACAFPAWRAARVDPIEALRAQ